MPDTWLKDKSPDPLPSCVQFDFLNQREKEDYFLCVYQGDKSAVRDILLSPNTL